jgi:hypothetical protein
VKKWLSDTYSLQAVLFSSPYKEMAAYEARPVELFDTVSVVIEKGFCV